MPKKSKARRGYRNFSLQVLTSREKISGWSISGVDPKPVKNLDGRPSRRVSDTNLKAYFKDIQGYWRRTDTNIDIDLDNLCAATHGHIRRSIISDVEFKIFHSEIPDWAHMAGIEPESRVTKTKFERLIAGSTSDDLLHKFIYLQDVQNLLTNIQRTSAQITQVIGEFYGILNDCVPYRYSIDERSGLRSSVGAETALLHAHLETVFVRMRSLLDYAVKVWLEAERVNIDYSKIVKLKGGSKQYGDKGSLGVNEQAGTLFVKDELIWTICSIRDRIVHDGHLDVSARMYESFKRRRLVERFVLIPDMVEGRFESFKNRSNFYGRDHKINHDLPRIYDDFFQRMLATIGALHDLYASKMIH
ncbi:hypothetical protein [Ponticaulis profundi]|uniref:Cthe-2314-like HEPN domain-containing protein n=1 Tax=Ponticaulis profundi TaxID=2665222 RepID=A0ABW1SCU5_9PROT